VDEKKKFIMKNRARLLSSIKSGSILARTTCSYDIAQQCATMRTNKQSRGECFGGEIMEHAGIHDEKYRLIPNAFYARLSAGN